MEHVPTLAAGDAKGPRRSLIFAGGGMRVAYQAGVLRALREEGEARLQSHGREMRNTVAVFRSLSEQ